MSSPAQPPAPQPQYCTSHFVTGEYQPVVSFLDEVAYAQCLDTLVKACNDMLLTRPDGKVFLGKRQVFVRPEHARPQKDWWYGVGGRMKPGETVFDSCHRLLQREVKVDVSVADLKKRLQTVGHYSFVWGKREQLPQTNGTADISVVVSLALTSSEVAAIVPDEFEHREWMSPAEILTGDFHPALKRSMQDYVQLQRFKELDALLLEGRRVKLAPEHPISDAMKALSSPAEASADAPITDAEMVAACRQFLQYHRFISQKDTESIPCKETL